MTNKQGLFFRQFSFGAGETDDGFLPVGKDTLYTPELGYGFVTEEVRQSSELLQLPAINNGFSPNPQGVDPASVQMAREGEGNALRQSFCYSDAPDMPLYFRVKVPHSGNYTVRLLMGSCERETDVTVFSERRRCVLRDAHADKGKFVEFSFTANVCDTIPRGKKKPYHDEAVDITLLGKGARLNALTVREEPEAPTIYIAGDSTVTDQPGEYPYAPGECYCGWAQMFPMFFKPGIAVSNHAHSGLTTASFRDAGHWDIVRASIRPGDYLFIQFGHNDQKNKDLSAFGGYAKNLERFVDEARELGAQPVIVTPVSRSLWNASGGQFNDLLADCAHACRMVAEKKQAELVDLHAMSVDFILEKGKDESLKYFHPQDYTHFNDFGAAVMASFVAQGVRRANLPGLQKFLRDIRIDGARLPQADAARKTPLHAVKVRESWRGAPLPEFSDIGGLAEKQDILEVARRGVMAGKDGRFNPNGPFTRAEFLSSLGIAFHYLPKNVYNDVYSDVFGDEWYAGNVQASYDKGLIDPEMTPDGKFRPAEPVTACDALSVLLNVLKVSYGARLDAGPGLDREKRVAAQAAQAGILERPDEFSAPESALARAGMARLFRRAMDAAQEYEK